MMLVCLSCLDSFWCNSYSTWQCVRITLGQKNGIEYCIANRSNKWCWHNLAGLLGWLLHSKKFVDFLQPPSWTPLVHWTSFGSATSPTPVKRNSQRMRLRPRHPITQIELAPSLPRLSNVAQKPWFSGMVPRRGSPQASSCKKSQHDPYVESPQRSHQPSVLILLDAQGSARDQHLEPHWPSSWSSLFPPSKFEASQAVDFGSESYLTFAAAPKQTHLSLHRPHPSNEQVHAHLFPNFHQVGNLQGPAQSFKQIEHTKP